MNLMSIIIFVDIANGLLEQILFFYFNYAIIFSVVNKKITQLILINEEKHEIIIYDRYPRLR